MRALVVYYSLTGNTEKLARAIYEGVHVEKEIFSLAEVKSVAGYDIIFIGFPIQGHSVPPPLLTFFGKLPPGQAIALFCTHGSLRGGHLPKQALEQAMGLASKAKIIGTFGVRGVVESNIIETLQERPEHRAWAEEARGAGDHPTEADLADGRTFAAGIMARIGGAF